MVKSISKSYGVPGVRLGILASSNTDVIADMKKDVAIWNINSFGEFYMQIMEKYNKDYVASLAKLRTARAKLVQGLESIPYIKVFPSQANYVMCELSGITGHELCCLLLKKDILIKDLTKKIGEADGRQYIRLAVRDEKDNDALVAALKEVEVR